MQTTNGTISGKTTTSNGQPISNVCLTVYANQCKENWTGQTRSDENGNYSITAPAGSYYMITNASCQTQQNYIDEWWNSEGGTLNCNEAVQITVTSGQTTSGINFSLAIGGKIAGVITRDSDGQPIEGLRVYAEDYSTGDWFDGVDTQSDGSYTITGLPAGTYRVCTNIWDTDYAGEYYNNTYSEDSAMPVTVTSGQTTSGIDFGLAIGGKIAGAITRDSDDQPIAGIEVKAKDNSWDTICDADTQSDGSYIITGLPAGTYRVVTDTDGTEYAREYYNNVSNLDSATLVQVTAGQTTSEIDFSLTNVSNLWIPGHAPSGNQTMPVSEVRVRFNKEIQAATFTADDIKIIGPSNSIIAVVDGPTFVEDNTYIIRFNKQTELGIYHVHIGPQIMDLNGAIMDQDGDGILGEPEEDRYDAMFVIIDAFGPRIVSHTPSGSAASPVDHLDIDFNEEIDSASFDVDDISITGPEGAILPDSVTQSDGDSFRIGFAAQVLAGIYEIVIGTDILDMSGNKMDQDEDLTNGEPVEDQYTATFSIISMPRIVSHTPSGDQTEPVSEVMVTFNKEIKYPHLHYK